MAKSCWINISSNIPSTMFLFGLLMAVLKPTGARIGVCYGTKGINLPPAMEVVALIQQINIQRVRLYAPNEEALQALRGTNIKVMLDVPIQDLQHVAASQVNADLWVQNNIQKYSDVNFQYIAIGNEVKPSDSFARLLFPAMLNIRNAIVAAGLGNQIKVSTATYTALLGASYPPSSGEINCDFLELLGPVIHFLRDNQAPLLVNAYPYYSYAGNPAQISLQYALFTSPSPVVTDGPLQYFNLFDAMLDAIYSGLEKAGGGSLDIVVSETGWPTEGGVAASVENAKTYNKNLIQHVTQGTPKKPGKPVETYLYSMFDGNDRQELEDGKKWGLFLPNKRGKYFISFNSEFNRTGEN